MAGHSRGEQDRSYGGYRPGRGNGSKPGGGRLGKNRTGTGRTQSGRVQPVPAPGPYQPASGERRSDESIRHDVTARLAQHSQIDASQIEIEVQDGQVTLKGSVDTSDARRFAELATAAIPGVIAVHDQMEVRGD